VFRLICAGRREAGPYVIIARPRSVPVGTENRHGARRFSSFHHSPLIIHNFLSGQPIETDELVNLPGSHTPKGIRVLKELVVGYSFQIQGIEDRNIKVFLVSYLTKPET